MQAKARAIDGIDFEARLLAQDDARRAGISLRDWLDEVVAAHASKAGVHVEDFDSDQRLEIIAAKLGSLGSNGTSSRGSEWNALQDRSESLRDSLSRRRWRDRDDDAPAPRASDRRPPARDAAPDHGEMPYSGRRSIRDLDRAAESELDAAISLREENGRVRETRTAAALADVTRWIPKSEADQSGERNALDVIADRLARIDQYVARRRDDDGYRPSRETLDQLEDRIRTIAREADTKAQLPAAHNSILHDLGDRLSDLTDKIEHLERAGSPRERAEHFSRFGSKLGSILASLERQLTKPEPEPAKAPPPEVAPTRPISAQPARRPGLDRRASSLESIDNAVAEIAKRQRALDTGSEGPQPGSRPFGQQGNGARRNGDATPAQQPTGREPNPVQTTAAPDFDPGIDIAAFDRRLETIALRIERAMERAEPTPAALSAPDIEAMRREIAAIGRGVAELTDASTRGSASTIAGIQGEIARLATRMERALAADREPEGDVLRHEIHEMARVIADLASTNARKEASAVSTLQGEIAKLASQLQQPRRHEPDADIQRLRQDVSEMSATLADVLSRGSTSALEGAVRELAKRIEASRDDGVRETLLAPVERMANEVRAALRELDPRETVGALDGEIRKIGCRLEEMSRRDVDAEAVGRIQDQTREIRDLLSAAAQRPMPLQHIEAQIAALGERLEDVAAYHTSGGDLAMRSDDIRALLKDAIPFDTIAALEHRVEALAERIDESLSRPTPERAIDALNSRVERLQQTLSQQPGGAGDTRALESMVRRLADSVEEIRDSGTDAGSIEALQGQFAKIMSRLDRSDAGLASLGAIERSMSDLFSRLEDTRGAAEAAARSAVREAMEAGGGETRSVRPHVESIGRELAELRAMHDEADRRMHATLSAVHGTLEKVVDRLSMLEDEPRAAAQRSATPVEAREPARRQPTPPGERAPVESAPAAVPMRPAAAPDVLPVTAAAASTRQVAAPRPEVDVDAPDFLIEPGSGAPTARNSGKARERAAAPAPAAGKPAEQPASSSFIAAARRAAQAAAAESAAATAARGRQDGRDAPITAGAGAAEQVKAFVAEKKRPLLLGMAGLVIVLGAYGIFHGFTSGQSEPEQPPAAAVPAAPPRKESPRTQQETPPVPAPGKQSSAGSANAGSQLLDSTPTGSVATPGGLPLGGSPTMSAPRVMPLRDAALQGNPSAQYEMGTRLAEGRLMPRDLKAASQWFEKAAAQGSAPAQYRLGALYEKGSGVPKDMTLAVAWYQRAADAGNARAMHNLAVITAEGATGGKPNYTTAVNWFRKAADLGVRDSQYNLAILTARGLGTQQDLPESYMWFSLAALQGDVDAGKKRDEVAKQLDAATLASAKARVEAFKPQPLNRFANVVSAPPGGWDASPSLSRGVQMPRAKVSGL